MKLSVLLRCACIAPVLALAACNVSINPPVQSIVEKTFLGDPELDGYVYSSNGATGTGSTKNTVIRVGDNSFDQSRRGILSFPIPEVPAGAKIVEATLVVYQGMPGNMPYDLGPNLFVDHVDLQGTLDKTDYESAPLHPAIGVLSTDAIPGARSLIVTEAVQSDVDTGRTSSEYRLWFSGATNGDGTTDSARFNDADDHLGNGIVPRLIIKWEE